MCEQQRFRAERPTRRRKRSQHHLLSFRFREDARLRLHFPCRTIALPACESSKSRRHSAPTTRSPRPYSGLAGFDLDADRAERFARPHLIQCGSNGGGASQGTALVCTLRCSTGDRRIAHPNCRSKHLVDDRANGRRRRDGGRWTTSEGTPTPSRRGMAWKLGSSVDSNRQPARTPNPRFYRVAARRFWLAVSRSAGSGATRL